MSRRQRLMLALTTAVSVAACRPRDRPLAVDAAPAGAGAKTTQPGTILYPKAPGSFANLIGEARASVVAIKSGTPIKNGPAAMFQEGNQAQPDVALGTGFLIEHNGPYVLTSDRTAGASNDLHVVLVDGREAPAKVVGRDPILDVALLSIDLPRIQTLKLGNSDDLKVGEWVVVLGNPFGDEVTASAGIVSATGRDTAGSLIRSNVMGLRTLLQLDARVNRGNAGGPVIDTAGQVVGIARAIGDRGGEVSFAVPINQVRDNLDALRDYGTVSRSRFGAVVKEITAETAAKVGLPEPTGVLVTEVIPGSPAARGGIRPGDVVLGWGPNRVDHRSLPTLVVTTPVGREVAVRVWRSGGEQVIKIVTDKLPP